MDQEIRPIRDVNAGETEKTPQLNATITAAAEVVGTHTVLATIQVNEYQDALAAKMPIEVWLSATAGGAAVSTNTTLTATTGVVVGSYTANAHVKVMTDATGKAVMSIVITGDATRYLCVQVGGTVFYSSELSWAA